MYLAMHCFVNSCTSKLIYLSFILWNYYTKLKPENFYLEITLYFFCVLHSYDKVYCTHTQNRLFVCSQLFQRNRTRVPHPHELLRIFRFPTSEGREIARAAEKIERTLNIVQTHIESDMVFNLTGKYFKISCVFIEKWQE